MKHWKMKNEKFLLDIQTKCGDIANEILIAAIDAERTFKCMGPYFERLNLDLREVIFQVEVETKSWDKKLMTAGKK